MTIRLVNVGLTDSVNRYIARREAYKLRRAKRLGLPLEPHRAAIEREVADAQEELKLREFERVMAGET